MGLDMPRPLQGDVSFTNALAHELTTLRGALLDPYFHPVSDKVRATHYAKLLADSRSQYAGLRSAQLKQLY